MSAPTLLLDVGSTLLRRRRGGPVSRVVEALARIDPALAKSSTETVERRLQTGLDREQAIEALAAEVSAGSEDLRPCLRAAIDQESDDYELLPGALEILDAARATGFQVRACTNMTRWQSPLPPPIAKRIDGVISSSAEGLLKRDPAFWGGLIRRGAVDPGRTLMIGDDPTGDGAVPSAAGIAAFVVGPERALGDLARRLRRLPTLPEETVGAAGGPPLEWGGHVTWEAPQLSALLERVTRRRVWLHRGPGPERVRTWLVRRRSLPPALLLPPQSDPDGLAWVTARPLRRKRLAPDDLVEALARAGLSADELSLAEQRHMYAMVREARDSEVRAERIADIVSYLACRR